MANYYLNSISGNDGNGGTSEAGAWASFAQAFDATNGITCGDTLWVKGTTAGYTAQDRTFPDNKPRPRVYGYSSVTGDSCSSGLMPLIDGDNGQGNLQRVDIQNFRINAKRTVWYANAFTLSGTSNRNYFENLQYRITDTADSSIGVNLIGADSVAHTIRSMYFSVVDTTPSARCTDSIFFTGNGGGRVRTEGCIFDGRGVDGGDALNYFNNTGYSGIAHKGSIFIGDPEQTHNGLHCVVDAYTYGVNIKKCIFYNCEVGIKLATSLTDNSSLSMSNNQNWIIEDCVFVNCGTGIELDSNISKWSSVTIKNCVFYTMTSHEINGDATIINKISATQNPYDPDNYCLSNYGNSLMDYPYRTWNGSSFVINEKRQLDNAPIRKFGVTDSGSLSLGGTAGLGDTVTVSGRSFQKISDNPIVWRRYNATVAADSVGSFVPTDISGIVAWWDPSDSSTITLSGNDVTGVENKVSGGIDLVVHNTAPSITSNYLNGKDVLNISTGDGLKTDSRLHASEMSYFMVINAGSDTKTILLRSSNSARYMTCYSSTETDTTIDYNAGTAIYHVNGATSGFTGGEGNNTRSDFANLVNPGGAGDWKILGGIGGSMTSSSWTDVQMFAGFDAGFEFTGHVAEMLFFDNSLSTINRQKVEGYLAHKWNLTENLPSDHPYKVYGP